VDRLIIQPDEGHQIDLGGLGVQFKIRGDETGGAFAVVEHPVDSGVVVEPHWHRNEDEYSYVLEGTIGVRVGDHEFEAGPGSYVFKPRGILHTFWNVSGAPARILEVISPAGFEVFFEKLASLVETGVAPDDARILALSEKYGLSFDHAWLRDLEKRYGPLRMV
jgi:quercetin dioxygenase-like cupin family protein